MLNVSKMRQVTMKTIHGLPGYVTIKMQAMPGWTS